MESTPGSFAEHRAAVDRLVLRIGETPGVVSVLPEPAGLGNATLGVRAEDRGSVARAANPVASLMKAVTPGYFDMIGVPLVRGSDVGRPSDTSRTIIIGSDLARRWWGDADPIGRRLIQIRPTGDAHARPGRERRVRLAIHRQRQLVVGVSRRHQDVGRRLSHSNCRSGAQSSRLRFGGSRARSFHPRRSRHC